MSKKMHKWSKVEKRLEKESVTKNREGKMFIKENEGKSWNTRGVVGWVVV